MIRPAHLRKARGPRANRFALTLAEALCSLVFCGGLVCSVLCFGPRAVLIGMAIGLLLLPLVMLWGAVYLRTPELAGNLVALAGLLFFFAALAPYGLVQSREQSRQAQARYYAYQAAQARQIQQWEAHRLESRSRSY